MGRCRLCGNSAGLFREHHADCLARRDRAISQIPGLIERLLESPIPATRFSALLTEVATSCFLKPEELERLCVDGFSNLLASIFERRLPTETEEQRIRGIMQALDDDFPDRTGFAELMMKSEILRILDQAQVPNAIELGSALPVKLRRGETVLWIFNRVQSYEDVADGNHPHGISIASGPYSYAKTTHFSAPATAAGKRGKGRGDLILTNYSMFFLPKSGKHQKIPISRITRLEPYSNAVYVGCGLEDLWSVYEVSDPWFLFNALLMLTKQMRSVRSHDGD
jgi:hypothetical protein